VILKKRTFAVCAVALMVVIASVVRMNARVIQVRPSQNPRQNVKAYNSIIYMLSVACAALILNACETTGPVAASAQPRNLDQILPDRAPTFGNDLERLPNPGMLMTRSSLASVH
jgi:hypothetical protein